MKEAKAYLDCANEAVGALAHMMSIVLIAGPGIAGVDINDAEQVLDALRVLRPDLADLDMFYGFLHMARSNWHDAIKVFRSLCDQGKCLPGSKAMLMHCMSCSGDTEWIIEANALLREELPPDLRLLVQADAVQHGLINEADVDWPPPADAQGASQTAQGPAANDGRVSSQETDAMLHSQYMRI